MKGSQFLLSAAVVAALAVPVLADDDADGIRVVIGFKGDANADLLAQDGATVDGIDASGKVAIAHVPAERLAAIAQNASVAYVEQDGICEASGKPSSSTTQPPETVGWGVSRVWGASQPTATGAGVKVAIIDTGIDLTHPDLAGNIKGGINLVRTNRSPNDDNGHGSHVAGIVAAIDNTIGYVGVAPGASLYAVKVLDARGSGYLSTVAAGIDWARQNGMNVGNMSLGGSSGTSQLQAACDNAAAAGVLLVAAAGNSGDGSTLTVETSYPAQYSSVVAVGATDYADAVASFSNTGPKVEVSAPGVSIPSTYKGGGYATLSGTSMASPHAAGLAAVLLSAGSTASTIRADLDAHVRDLGPSGRDYGYGFGIAYYPVP